MNLEEFIHKIKKASKAGLPGDPAHLEMTPYKKGLAIKPESPRLSAVMIVAYEMNMQTEIILLKRADYEGVHSSQVSFPGGKKDEADPDLEYTAVRELEEETGIIRNKIEIISTLSPMFIPPSNFMVHPFVSVSHSVPEIRLDSRESQYHFGGKITDLLNEENLRRTDIKTSYGNIKDVPYFHLNNEVVWGATAAILNEMREILRRK